METEEKNKPKKVEFVEKVKKVPYICVVPAGGLRAIKCYPDARTFFCRRAESRVFPKQTNFACHKWLSAGTSNKGVYSHGEFYICTRDLRKVWDR